MDFNNYDLSALRDTRGGVYALAGGMLWDIASRFGYPLSDQPTEAEIGGFIKAVGPHKELQRNIAHVMEVLGPDAISTAAAWLENSGVMDALSGPFVCPRRPTPGYVDAIIWSGGVANWMIRRRELTLSLHLTSVGHILLPIGNRSMKVDEHELVAELGGEPTEFDFAKAYVLPKLSRAGFSVTLLPVNSAKGDEILEAAFLEYPRYLYGSVLVVGNAPNTVQGAGQLRAAAQKVNPAFDRNDSQPQLFMMGDYFPVARHGEPAATHQNPLSGIGQILRNALFLHRALAA